MVTFQRRCATVKFGNRIQFNDTSVELRHYGCARRRAVPPERYMLLPYDIPRFLNQMITLYTDNPLNGRQEAEDLDKIEAR